MGSKLPLVLDYIPCEACLEIPSPDQEILCSVCRRLRRSVVVTKRRVVERGIPLEPEFERVSFEEYFEYVPLPQTPIEIPKGPPEEPPSMERPSPPAEEPPPQTESPPPSEEPPPPIEPPPTPPPPIPDYLWPEERVGPPPMEVRAEEFLPVEEEGPAPFEVVGTEDSLEIEELSGLGPTHSERLRPLGVLTFADLAQSDPSKLSQKTGVPLRLVERWVGASRFVLLGVPVLHAEALLDLGIRTPEDLLPLREEEVVSRIHSLEGARGVLGRVPPVTPQEVQRWKRRVVGGTPGPSG